MTSRYNTNIETRINIKNFWTWLRMKEKPNSKFKSGQSPVRHNVPQKFAIRKFEWNTVALRDHWDFRRQTWLNFKGT